jgi:DNA helicase-2/ATP-dependent DNA helicase PcrA
MSKNILTGLNERQAEAVTSKNKRVLVIAGAGSGKTSVLTKRVAYLLDNDFPSDSIFAVTFTNKAAKEMKERVEVLLEDQNVSSMWLGTFHSLFNRILRKHAHMVSVETNYEIISDDDQKKILKLVASEDLKLFQEFEGRERSTMIKEAVNESIMYISSCKDKGKRPEDCEWTNFESSKFCTNLLAIYFRYEERMRELNVVDFGDLILYPYIILRDNPNILSIYRNAFKHVLVDEFQDTNFTQYELVKMIAGTDYLFVVGDDDQSIYEWRGANVENILDYDQLFKDAHIVKLEQNYRSTEHILNGANGLIGMNQKRRGKTLWSTNGAGDKIQVHTFNTPYEEAEFVATNIYNKVREGKDPKDFAILYRINALSRNMEMKLNDFKIPYKIIGGLAFWARSEIKDMLAYLSVIENPSNSLAFERIVNVPTRGIGEKSFIKIRTFAEDNKLTIKEAMDRMIEEKAFPKKASENITEFKDLISELHVMKENGALIKDYIEYILENTSLIDFYKEDGSEKGDERVANLMELISASESFETSSQENSIQDFVNFAMLQTTYDKDANSNSVQLMTVHTAKGLEFDTVFVIGMEDDIFPSARSMKEKKIEEERRLAYVALTRAKKHLFLSSAAARFPNASYNTSMFIDEIPEEHYELFDHKKSYGQNQYNGFKDNVDKARQAKSMSYDNIKVGKDINHNKFGKGKILSYTNEGGYYLITVNFEKHGKKTIMYTK